MVRPFAAKGKKRKKTERYDRDDDGEESTASAKKAMVENEPDEQPENEAAEETFHELEGIPIVPKDPKSDSKAGVIFVLERASLEVAKVGKVGILFFMHRFLACCFGVLGFNSIMAFN